MSDNDKRGGNSDNPNTGVVVKTRPKTRKPAMYKVLMLNDDYTPMEFVVHVLERFFQKTREEATRIMLHVHRRGVGVCGAFTYEVAETMVTQVMELDRHRERVRLSLTKPHLSYIFTPVSGAPSRAHSGRLPSHSLCGSFVLCAKERHRYVVSQP